MALLVNVLLSLGILYLLWKDQFTNKQLLLGGIFVLAMFFSFINDMKNNFRVNYQFIPTQCRIIEKGMITKEYTRSRLYYANFQAECYVGDQLVTQSIQLNISDYGSLSSQAAMQIVNAFNIGEVYPCWYDPANPTIVVLQQGWETTVNSWKITFIGALILIVMAWKIFFPD
ncbi:MAG: hypothetical protein ACD_46C00502G0003 [uncultured bacterium]|nr:MAG: hypothetical protein ACD_46C00502G0003 [uncultured bacterium]